MKAEVSMSTPTANGGYVITLKTNNIIRQMRVDNAVLSQIVEALGIKSRAPNIEPRIPDIQSIYVYRGDE
jgi:hypothetical protein